LDTDDATVTAILLAEWLARGNKHEPGYWESPSDDPPPIALVRENDIWWAIDSKVMRNFRGDER
jgi:hypothetical protein